VTRRLFWKVYLTLLASLVVVAILVGVVWRVTGEHVFSRWNAFRVHLADVQIPNSDVPPGSLDAALRRLGEAVGADVTVYDADRRFVASRGEPIALPPGDDDPHQRWRDHVVRVDLPDGRIVLARLNPPPPEPALRILLLVLLVAGGVGLAAYPLTARLTRRLEDLRFGVERWGGGSLSTRVKESGRDEVALVARAFNDAASRIEGLLAAQKALLANASHELRSPLARLRMAVEMSDEAPSRSARHEITRSLAEIDQIVDEVLLSSRLDHFAAETLRPRPTDLLGLAAEEAARVGASAGGDALEVEGDPRLLRRLIRNLLENAAKHGAPPVEITIERGPGLARIAVSDAGPGIPDGERGKVFEPFYRPRGRSEASGGWGLGLSLVRQIAERHGGSVRCEAGPAGGSLFIVDLPVGG
jgi:signal transduction histidine kinase